MSIKRFPFARVGLALYAGSFLWLWLYMRLNGLVWLWDAPVYRPPKVMMQIGIGFLMLAAIRGIVRRLGRYAASRRSRAAQM